MGRWRGRWVCSNLWPAGPGQKLDQPSACAWAVLWSGGRWSSWSQTGLPGQMNLTGFWCEFSLLEGPKVGGGSAWNNSAFQLSKAFAAHEQKSVIWRESQITAISGWWTSADTRGWCSSTALTEVCRGADILRANLPMSGCSHTPAWHGGSWGLQPREVRPRKNALLRIPRSHGVYRQPG